MGHFPLTADSLLPLGVDSGPHTKSGASEDLALGEPPYPTKNFICLKDAHKLPLPLISRKSLIPVALPIWHSQLLTWNGK